MKLLPLNIDALRQSPAIRVWRNPNFVRFMLGLGPYYVTNWIQRVAVGWLAWELSHSHAWVGAIAAADLAPMMVLGPFAGAIADRTNPLKMLRWAQLIMSVEALIMALVTISGHMTVGLLFFLALVTGTMQPLYTAGRQMVVPASVQRADFPSAVSLDSSLFHGSRFIGPMLSAIIIAWGGVAAAFLVHVAGCLTFYLMASRIDLHFDRSERPTGSVLAEIGAAFDYVVNHVGLWPLFCLMFMTSVVARPLQDLLPGFAGDVFHAGPTGLAWLTSGMGIGAMCSALFVAMRGHIRGLVALTILSSAVLGVTTWIFVSTSILAVAVVVGVVWGFALTLLGTSVQTMTQIAVTDAMRGRVMILVAMLYRGVPALGAVLIGVAAEFVGLSAAFKVSALICIAGWLILWRRQRVIDEAIQVPSH
jgi:MFS family permease